MHAHPADVLFAFYSAKIVARLN